MNNSNTVTQRLDGKIIFLGDVHGHVDLIERVLNHYNFDASRDQVVCVGDLIDKGPHSAACLNYLNEPWFHSVKGNHEQTLIDYFRSPSDNLEQLWKRNGGDWWFNGSLTTEEQLECVKLCSQMPTAVTVDLINGDKVGVVHASAPLTNWKRFVNNADDPSFSHYALTSRDNIEAGRHHVVEDVSMVVVGHTPNRHMLVLGNTVHIDTGAHSHPGRMLPALDDQELSDVYSMLVKPSLNALATNTQQNNPMDNDDIYDAFDLNQAARP